VGEKLDLGGSGEPHRVPGVWTRLTISVGSYLSEREADDRAFSITILVPPGNPKGAVGEPKLACCPKEDAETSDLETRFAHLGRFVLR